MLIRFQIFIKVFIIRRVLLQYHRSTPHQIWHSVSCYCAINVYLIFRLERENNIKYVLMKNVLTFETVVSEFYKKYICDKSRNLCLGRNKNVLLHPRKKYVIFTMVVVIYDAKCIVSHAFTKFSFTIK